jgi:hypothetical protein
MPEFAIAESIVTDQIETIYEGKELTKLQKYLNTIKALKWEEATNLDTRVVIDVYGKRGWKFRISFDAFGDYKYKGRICVRDEMLTEIVENIIATKFLKPIKQYH